MTTRDLSALPMPAAPATPGSPPSEARLGRLRGLVSAAETLRTRVMDAAAVATRAAVTVDAPPEVVYDQWWALAMPAGVPQVEPDTLRSGGGPQGPARIPGLVERDAEVLEDVPGQVVAWRTMGRAPALALGRVELRAAPGDRGTEVRVDVATTQPPALLRPLLRRHRPDQRLREALRTFKATVEAGGPLSVKGQTHGHRSPAQQMLHAAALGGLKGGRA
jgi:uncharacterized membrane protein